MHSFFFTNIYILWYNKYDAWGNCSVFDGDGKPLDYSTDSDNIAFINPFRYRGYYYDDETGLYYLQTRYYDPETRRFISPDTYAYLDPTFTHGLNLYLYCNNDPVNKYDPSGHFPLVILLAYIVLGVAGAAIGGTYAYHVAEENGKEGWDLFWATLGGALLGGAVGIATAGLGVSLGVSIAGMIGSTELAFVIGGVEATKIVAGGILAYNLFAALVAPLVGLEMELIGWSDSKNTPVVPKPEINKSKYPY